jgi:hypothetical protein
MHENVWDRQELLFRIKLLKDRVEAFENGDQYVRMKKMHQIAREGDFETIKQLKRELSRERNEKTHVRELWYNTCLGIQRECEKKLQKKDKECEKKLAEKDKLILSLQKELQNEQQKCEEYHDKYLNDPDYHPTGRIIRKQLIKVCVNTEVIEYWTYEFRNSVTGQREHADFPPGYVDDVNYDGTVKAFAYLLNNDLYTSIDKTRVFLRDISKRKIDISTGFICNLSKQFSECTQEERDRIFKELMTEEVLHADFTFGRTGGKQSAVIITTGNGKVLYQGRTKKGDEGVKGSPVEYYSGTLVSDHEAALIKHGERHQECLGHVKRYAKAEAENEPENTWGTKLDAWISDSVGSYRRGLLGCNFQGCQFCIGIKHRRPDPVNGNRLISE